ncbi:MAG: MMPL family transporter, partial [Clostridiales bacterium]
IETSVWLNLSFPYFIGKPIFYLAYLIISSIQLGATVDYAILLASRYLENRNTLLPQAAVCKTLCDTTLSILTSASILSLGGTMLGLLSSNQVISQLGILVGRGAVLSAFLVLFILPALLYFNDALIQKTTMGLTFQTEELKS